MDSTFSLSTTLSIPFTIPKVRNGCLISPTRYYSFHPPHFCLRTSCVASPLVHSQLKCLSNSASYSVNKTSSSATKGALEAIILDVGGMTSSECASSVKRILENHAHMYVASVNLSTETAIVWPTSDAKVEPGWDRLLGDELANHLTSCGFRSNLRELENFHGCFKNTPYTEWPAHTISSLAPLDSELESHAKEVEALKEEVKDLLLNSTRDLTDNIRCINSLIRLGVSYHFEDDIEQQLHRIFTMLPKFVEDNDYDLCTVANFFRILRQNGYSVPCDVFEKYKDGDGGFKKDIANDVKGIICLYEACFVAIPGEYMLEEALAFTRKHLEVLAENSSPGLQTYIRHALMFPSHRTTERLDALHYISYYEEDEAANEILLKFAKLDFNRLQLLYKKELALLSKWWEDTNVMENFPYTRDRVIESYFWALGCIFEPQYSSSRMLIAKYTQLLTFVDDTYDTYGTFEHLQPLTNSIQRLTIDGAGEELLPDYMKNICRILNDDLKNHNGMKGCSFEDSSDNGTKGYSYKTSYLEEMIKEYAKCNFVEAKWKKEGKAPSFDEYMKIGRVTCAYETLASALMLGIEDIGMKEILCIRYQPEMVTSAQFIGRLTNDIIGRTDEKQRQDFPKAVDCYMEQYRVSEDEAVEAIEKMIENKWKIMNKENIKESNIPKILLKYTFNYCRITRVMNGAIDIFTYPTKLNELIVLMFLKPLPV